MSAPDGFAATSRFDELREKALRHGRVNTDDGPVWEVPSWSLVLELLDEIDRRVPLYAKEGFSIEHEE